VAVVLVALVIGGVAGFAISHHGRGHAGGPGWSRAAGPGAALGPGAHGWFGPGRGGERFRADRRGGLAGSAPVIGTVTSVSGPSLVVAQDGGAPVTVTTSDRTRVFGAQQRSVSDLKAGQRVAVRVGANNTALGVLVLTASDRGTITALNGTMATLTQPDGLTRTVDTSGLATQPKQGDLVAVQGTVANNGGTLVAQTLRTLPKGS
jgi:hypothetical protein